mgnify:FL=1
MSQSEASRRANANIKRLICIRMFFNARFYYPIFALFFLEHGLSWVQFGILNAIWAVTIILLEVPSGALADTIGRKKLIVFAALCMVAEMLALLLAPMDGSEIVFLLFALNRVISGVAEAAVSGADEALAYDSLKAAGREDEWNQVLAKVQRYTSLAFFFAMMTGSAFYAHTFVNGLLDWMGTGLRFDEATLIKFPIQLTLFSSFVVLVASMGMTDATVRDKQASAMDTIRESLRKTKEAGAWIWSTPMPFAILLASMVLDNVIRQFLTIGAAYWKVTEYPLATFGLVASSMSLMGFFVPSLAKILAEKRTPKQNFSFLCVVLIIGLFGIGEVIPYWGIVPAAMLYFTMQCMNYFVSVYLNQEAESEKRATILSFRSLATNLSYGAACLLYSLLIWWIQNRGVDTVVHGRVMTEQDAEFVEAIGWFPWYFIVTLLGMIALYLFRFRKKESPFKE